MLYEIQVFREQVWKVDSVFDDKDLAVYEARRLNTSGRYLAVRVMEDFIDLRTGLPRLRPIFRASKLQNAAARTAGEVEGDDERIGRIMRGTRPSAVPKPKGIGVMTLVFKTVLTAVLLGAGVGVLYWLEPLLNRGLS